MKSAYLILLTCLFSNLYNLVLANDGSYLTKGGLFYPTTETKISMDKEVLSFKVVNGWCEVNVAFEFNNPEKEARKLTVGFQAPTAVGDVDEETQSTNMIKDFLIQQNGNLLSYQLKIAECEDCPLQEIGSWSPKHQGDGGVFVYLFEITFQPGINKINHSYRFPASSMVYKNQMYNYILTTGSKWAGETIKDLTVEIDMGGNSYFYVKDIFGKSASWNILGTGKVTSKRYPDYDDIDHQMVRILSGKLQIHVKNLKPVNNIEFGIHDNLSFICQALNSEQIENKEVYILNDYNLDEGATKEMLRILRNTIYAQHGLTFSSGDLKNYFSQFDWYIPVPNLKQNEIILSNEELELLHLIQQKEKELSND